MKSIRRDVLLVTLADYNRRNFFFCVLVRLKRKEFRSDDNFVIKFNKVNLDAFTERPRDLVCMLWPAD